MKAFLVGLMVLFLLGLFSVVGILLFPLLIVFGFFLRFFILLAFFLFGIWLTGKLTLFLIESLHRKR